MLDDRTLRYVAVVARLGSIRAAARELGLAPSAIQRSIVAAERQVGMRLFERSVRGVITTEAGQIVVIQAQGRDDLDLHLAAQLEELRGLARGTVTIASGEGFIAELWNQVLDPFLAKHPGINVVLHTAGSDDLVNLLSTDEADVAIVLHPRSDPAVQVVRTRAEPLQVICRPDHNFASRATIAPAELDGTDLAMLPQRFGIRVLQDQLMRTYGVSVNPRLESTSQATIINAVRSGRALALLPPVTVRRYVNTGELAAVPITDPQVSLVQAKLLVRRGRLLLPAARRLLSTCARAMFPENEDAVS